MKRNEEENIKKMLLVALCAAVCGTARAAETNTLVEMVRDWVAVNAYADVGFKGDCPHLI